MGGGLGHLVLPSGSKSDNPRVFMHVLELESLGRVQSEHSLDQIGSVC